LWIIKWRVSGACMISCVLCFVCQGWFVLLLDVQMLPRMQGTGRTSQMVAT
jgi:hypothetical protein